MDEETVVRKVIFDPRITLGNILTVLSVAGALLVWGLRLEGRVDQAELMISIMRQQGTNDDIRQNALDTEIKASLRRIEDKLDNKQDRVK